jgi:hypothetical protein
MYCIWEFVTSDVGGIFIVISLKETQFVVLKTVDMITISSEWMFGLMEK